MPYNSADWMREVEHFSNKVKDYFENLDIRVSDVKDPRRKEFPPIEVVEDDTNLYVLAELPGMKKEEIRINLNGDRGLSISGMKGKGTADGGKELVNERWFGSFNRMVSLPDKVEIDSERISASYTDGVLRIVLPKTGGSASRPIEII